MPCSAHWTGVGLGIAVEQLADGVGSRQALPGVLAVDVEQQIAQGAQLRGSGRAAVDEGTALAGRIDRAAQQQAALHVKTGFLQPGLGGGSRIKFGGNVAAAGAFAHHAGVGAGAQRQLQRVDQNRFACTGLAGQHRKAATQVQLECVDDHKIPQGDVRQGHAQAPSFQCIFLRKVSK